MFGKKKTKTEMDSWREEEDQPNPTLNPNAHFYRGNLITEEQYQRLIKGHQMPSGTWPVSGTGMSEHYFGQTYRENRFQSTPTIDIDVEALWEKMYEHAMAVIVVCPWCGIPQPISNGTCMGCGGVLPKPKPLGR